MLIHEEARSDIPHSQGAKTVTYRTPVNPMAALSILIELHRTAAPLLGEGHHLGEPGAAAIRLLREHILDTSDPQYLNGAGEWSQVSTVEWDTQTVLYELARGGRVIVGKYGALTLEDVDSASGSSEKPVAILTGDEALSRLGLSKNATPYEPAPEYLTCEDDRDGYGTITGETRSRPLALADYLTTCTDSTLETTELWTGRSLNNVLICDIADAMKGMQPAYRTATLEIYGHALELADKALAERMSRDGGGAPVVDIEYHDQPEFQPILNALKTGASIEVAAEMYQPPVEDASDGKAKGGVDIYTALVERIADVYTETSFKPTTLPISQKEWRELEEFCGSFGRSMPLTGSGRRAPQIVELLVERKLRTAYGTVTLIISPDETDVAEKTL